MSRQPTPLKPSAPSSPSPVGENAVFDGWTDKAVDSAAAQARRRPGAARGSPSPRTSPEWSTPISQGVDAAMEAHFTPDVIAGAEDPRPDPRADLVPAGDDGARRAKRCARALPSSPCRRIVALGAQDRLALRRPDVAARRRHRDRLQPLHQAADPGAASMARPCSPGSTTRARAGPRPRAFLDRRIGDVMRFEKWKAELARQRPSPPSLSRFLGRLRYPRALRCCSFPSRCSLLIISSQMTRPPSQLDPARPAQARHARAHRGDRLGSAGREPRPTGCAISASTRASPSSRCTSVRSAATRWRSASAA